MGQSGGGWPGINGKQAGRDACRFPKRKIRVSAKVTDTRTEYEKKWAVGMFLSWIHNPSRDSRAAQKSYTGKPAREAAITDCRIRTNEGWKKANA